MQSRILYHSPLLPACRTIRVMLKEKELEYELREENFWERRHDFFKMNPSGEVPVLVDEDGKSYAGLYSVSEYLDEKYPTVQFFGNSPAERAEVRRVIEWFSQKFQREVTDYVLTEKVFKRLMGYGEPDSTIIRAGKGNLAHHMEYISFLLADRNWLAGEYMTLADIAAAAHLSSLDYLGDVPWEKHAKTRDWYALIKSRPTFRALLSDRVQGYRPPEHYENPDF